MSRPRLFGTDGVRGRAGEPPLDPATVARLGAGVVMAIPPGAGAARILVGRDTRESAVWIESELARGAGWAGAQVTSAGVVPTPAIAYLTRAMRFDAGVVISASHNPFEDNGIKVFSGAGEKYDEALERHVEGLVADDSWVVGAADGPSIEARDFVSDYITHARAALPDVAALQGLRIAIDCANGATTTVAPRLFRELGFSVDTIGCEPDGRNINLACGSTHPERLARFVTERGHRLGVAFDGDGDRAILVTHHGRLVDGDAVMLMCARHLKAQGRLRGDTVVATVMSNIGLELALRSSGIALRRTPVGDKHVAAEIAEHGFSLGGEQSGHVIFADHLFTGDGIVTALSVINVMAESGRELADLAAELVTYPQVLVNVRVRDRRDLTTVPELSAAVARLEARLAEQGRLLVRYSGTEPLLRIMIEGRDQDQIDAWAHELADLVERHLGL
jgi:phosphoglucosamine mutase